MNWESTTYITQSKIISQYQIWREEIFNKIMNKDEEWLRKVESQAIIDKYGITGYTNSTKETKDDSDDDSQIDREGN